MLHSFFIFFILAWLLRSLVLHYTNNQQQRHSYVHIKFGPPSVWLREKIDGSTIRPITNNVQVHHAQELH